MLVVFKINFSEDVRSFDAKPLHVYRCSEGPGLIFFFFGLFTVAIFGLIFGSFSIILAVNK